MPVAKGARQGADHLEAIALPTGDAAGVGAHHQVELHRPEPAPPRLLAAELAVAFRRTPSPRLDDELPQVLPCFRLMLPDGALFTEDGVPIPVVIVADLRAMAAWLPAEAKRISGISCVGLAALPPT